MQNSPASQFKILVVCQSLLFFVVNQSVLPNLTHPDYTPASRPHINESRCQIRLLRKKQESTETALLTNKIEQLLYTVFTNRQKNLLQKNINNCSKLHFQ